LSSIAKVKLDLSKELPLDLILIEPPSGDWDLPSGFTVDFAVPDVREADDRDKKLEMT
jgi:hypothetical protein